MRGSVAIFDIDSTIMDTAPRNFRILREAAEEYPVIAPAVDQLSVGDMGWNVLDALKSCMTLSEDLARKISRFWSDRFFTNHYALEDAPYQGVAEILWWIHQEGCLLVYLTGRDEPGMSTGTRQSFVQANLPAGEGTRFILKPDFETPDLVFKRKALESIGRMGTVWVAVENEPANANLFAQMFPDARVLLIDTITSPNPDVPDPAVIRFCRYGPV
ncbi:Haloacid dehalogenase-like hydrolase [Alkalispirochaeta americana]|uniref:Haloacid dehalogenase-like hydrolase n=1 Tax=Alkalispirochaeta americana TaxID=159291 RepID=A0A1N6NJB4_9SPIO|nr:HAD hydrolase-like protein [Alkalispirochaeta americana]SIP92218.1 Haloacid dehalogenase-like hydrolase [Alkalispirochaeta americana]